MASRWLEAKFYGVALGTSVFGLGLGLEGAGRGLAGCIGNFLASLSSQGSATTVNVKLIVIEGKTILRTVAVIFTYT